MIPNLSSVLPQQDLFNQGLLLAEAVKDPDRYAPLLASTGQEPPTGSSDPFSGKPVQPQGPNPFNPVEGVDTAITGGRYQNPQYTTPPPLDMNAFGDPTGGGAAGVQPPKIPTVEPAPMQMPPQPQPVAPPAGVQPQKMPELRNPVLGAPMQGGVQPTVQNAPPTAPFPSYGQTATSPGMGEFASVPGIGADQPHPFADPRFETGASWTSGAPQGQPAPAQPAQARPPVAGGTVTAPNAPVIQGQAHPLDTIQKLENGSGNPQQVVDAGKGRRALGLYGVLNTNLPVWGPKFANRNVTEQEFLADPKLQRQIAQGQFDEYTKNFGLEGAVRRWIGLGGADKFGTDQHSYWKKFQEAAGKTQGPTFAGDLGQSVDPTIEPARAVPGGAAPMALGTGGQEVGSSRAAGPASQADVQKKLATLAEMLRGVSKPTAPGAGPTPPSPGHAPSPPGAQKIEGNLMAYLTALLGEGGGKKKVENLTLNEATPRKL